MTTAAIVAVAALAMCTVVVVTLAGLLRQERRQHARQQDLLLNQLLNLAGKPWQPAPADNRPPAEPAGEMEPVGWSWAPEQDAY